jgi:hypothetical protein
MATYGPGKRLKASASFQKARGKTMQSLQESDNNGQGRAPGMLLSYNAGGPSGQPVISGNGNNNPPPNSTSMFSQSSEGLPRDIHYGASSTGPGPANRLPRVETGGPQRSPSIIDILVLPSKTIKTVMGHQTNTRSHANIDVSPGSLFYPRALSRLQFAFIRKQNTGKFGNGNNQARYDAHADVGNPSAMDPLDVYSLQTTNYLLACSELEGQPHRSVEDILAEWAFAGGIVSDNGSATQDLAEGITFTLGVQGPESMYNIFGNDIRGGCPCGFLLMWCAVPEYYCLDPSGTYSDRVQGLNGEPCKRFAWQFIPWAHYRKEVNRNDVTFTLPDDDTGGLRKYYGAYMFVGKIEHRTEDSPEESVDAAWYSVPEMLKCKPIAFMHEVPSVRTY